jgi:hypothetical protein
LSLPGKKALLTTETECSIVIVDVGESPIERPKKKQKNYYSRKKKRHTLKSQIVIDAQSLRIICTAHGTGKEHDFQLFKRSQVKPLESTEILADKGYQGLKKIHTSSYTPIKKSKNKPLSSREKEYNQQLAKQRIYIEHIIRCLKIFRILAQPYRNRRRRFGLRFNLIAGLYNLGLSLAIA